MKIEIKKPKRLIVNEGNGRGLILSGKWCTIAAIYFETLKQLCILCIDCLCREVKI
jgi:hypothetical protein